VIAQQVVVGARDGGANIEQALLERKMYMSMLRRALLSAFSTWKTPSSGWTRSFIA
jgi:hypothetical protein